MENTKINQAEEFSFTVKLNMEEKKAIVIYGGQSVMDFSKLKGPSLTITCVGCGRIIAMPMHEALPINEIESFYHKCKR